jgi:broad specificity phosphatase PhoE
MQNRTPPLHDRLRTWAVHALLATLLLCTGTARADDAAWALLRNGGQVLLIRHAETDPGVGDPPGFSFADCATQRNLSDTGRRQALALGAAFRQRGIAVARVLSSPWCRCIDTATLAFGAHETSAMLSNLFEHGQNRERQTAAFGDLLGELPSARQVKAAKRGNLVLVTHGSTIAAFTGIVPAMGEIVIVTPSGNSAVRVAGRVTVPEDGAATNTSGSTR